MPKVILIGLPEPSSQILEEFKKGLENLKWSFLPENAPRPSKFHWEIKPLPDCDLVIGCKIPKIEKPVKMKKMKEKRPVKHWQHLNTAYKQGRHLK